MINNSNVGGSAAQTTIVTWTENLNTGIKIIDDQHKSLVDLTNELFRACLHGGEELDAEFKEAMSRMVEYVRFHFGFEQNMLQRVQFPNYVAHKAEHDSLIKEVLEATKDYGDAKKRFVPNNFVRYLRDWIITHIGHSDKIYAAYVADLKRKGLITDKDIEG